jgi:hypothetical protein
VTPPETVLRARRRQPIRRGHVMRILPKRLLGILAFALATLVATGALVAAGLNERSNASAADHAGCGVPCGTNVLR